MVVAGSRNRNFCDRLKSSITVIRGEFLGGRGAFAHNYITHTKNTVFGRLRSDFPSNLFVIFDFETEPRNYQT